MTTMTTMATMTTTADIAKNAEASKTTTTAVVTMAVTVAVAVAVAVAVGHTRLYCSTVSLKDRHAFAHTPRRSSVKVRVLVRRSAASQTVHTLFTLSTPLLHTPSPPCPPPCIKK